jgi:magnesium chelatase family protein
MKLCKNKKICLLIIPHTKTNNHTCWLKPFGSAGYGVEAITINAEVNWMQASVGPVIVGLADNAVKESMQRIESTIECIGISMPRTRIVFNLAPTDSKRAEQSSTFPLLSVSWLLPTV